eukprot:Awhi_evm1s12328
MIVIDDHDYVDGDGDDTDDTDDTVDTDDTDDTDVTDDNDDNDDNGEKDDNDYDINGNEKLKRREINVGYNRKGKKRI